jgi:hypothetical protein
MRGRSSHFRTPLIVALAAAAIAAILALGLSSGAVAAGMHPGCNSQAAPVVSCHFTDAFVDDDFCGTGRTVDFAFEGRFTVPADPSSGNWNNSITDAVLTNAATGATVLIHSAYRSTGTLLSGDPNAVHTVEWVFKGAAEVIRTPHGGVIARDAGNLVVDATLDGDEFVDAQIVTDRGEHTLFGGDCSILVPALGLT